MPATIRIGNAQGFWGDRPSAAAQLLEQVPDLDYLTLDYLAEVSLSIMAIQRDRHPDAGYARDFVEVVQSLMPFWQRGARVRVVTNAGGLHPRGCGIACREVLDRAGLHRMAVAVVTGDDVLPALQQALSDPESTDFANLDTGEPLRTIGDRLVTANAYLGAAPVVDALRSGADIVITGRVADPSLTVAPCVAAFGWSLDDYDRLASATVAGHLLECGTQVTGGISTDWLSLPDPIEIGFPYVEIDAEGGVVVTKGPGSGGRVSCTSVKEQLVYEIDNPAAYLSPDATVSLLGVSVDDAGRDRIRVTGAHGRPPPEHYKVSATYRDGYTATGMLTVYGRHAVRKARRAGEVLLQRVANAGFALQRTQIECLGSGACVPGLALGPAADELIETVLRVSVADARREAVQRFTREVASLVTNGPPGVTGYATGRPDVRPVFGYWPCLIERAQVRPTWERLASPLAASP